MAPIDLEARTRDLEQLVRFVAGRADSLREQEYVGTAADGLVTATLAGGTTTIGIHILAKRRLERDELSDAIVAAVRDAERQASDAIAGVFDEATDVPGVGADVRAGVARALRQIRSRVPGLPL